MKEALEQLVAYKAGISIADVGTEQLADFQKAPGIFLLRDHFIALAFALTASAATQFASTPQLLCTIGLFLKLHINRCACTDIAV
jgi:hypothetical protein